MHKSLFLLSDDKIGKHQYLLNKQCKINIHIWTVCTNIYLRVCRPINDQYTIISCAEHYLGANRINIQYTENKPLCHLYKMCNPFFHEFRDFPSANGFQLVCYTATLFTTEVDPDRHLAHFSGMREAVGHDFFSDRSLKEQAALAEAA